MQPSYLQIEASGVTRKVGWDGPWPPPKNLALVEGVETDGWTISDPTAVDPDIWAETLARMRVTPLRRASASVITDEEYGRMTHVARGALYVPTETP